MDNELEIMQKLIEVLCMKNEQGIPIERNDVIALKEQIIAANIGKPVNDIEKVIHILKRFFKEKDPKQFLENFTKPLYSKYLGIFVSDEYLPDSILLHPDKIGYNDALALFDPLAKYANDVSIAKTFILHFFMSRKREIWIPAARALVSLAMRDEGTRVTIEENWKKYFPAGLKSDLLKMIQGDAHWKRHIFFAVTLYIARTGNWHCFNGYNFSLLPELGFLLNDEDESWTSVQLLSYSELWSQPDARECIRKSLINGVDKLKKSFLVDDSIKKLYESIEVTGGKGSELTMALREMLLVKTFLDEDRNIDYLVEALWSWLSNVAFLSARKEVDPLEEIRGCEEMLNWSIRLDLGNLELFTFNEIRKRFIDNLTILLNRDQWVTHGRLFQTQCLLELILISRKTMISEFELGPFLRIASKTSGDSFSRYTWKARDGIFFFLAGHFDNSKIIPRIFFHGINHDLTTICHLSHVPNDMVSNHIAVQIETVMREKQSAGDIIKFMWQLLKSDPQPKVYIELLKLIDRKNTLYDVINSFREIDALRDKNKDGTFDLKMYIDKYHELICKLLILIKEDEHSASNQVRQESQNINELLLAIDNILLKLKEYTGEENIEMIIPRLEQLIGGEDQPKFIEWMKKVGLGILSVNKNWSNFVRRFKGIQTSAYIDTLTHEKFLESLLLLRQSLESITWLELTIIEKFFERFKTFADELRSHYEESKKNDELIAQWIKTNKLNKVESEVNKFLDNRSYGNTEPSSHCKTTITLLSVPSIDLLHEYLLNNFMFGLAEKFRKDDRIKSRVNLRSFWKFIAPLLFGIMAGPFFILDFGMEWNAILIKGREPAMLLIVGVSLLVSALFLGSRFFKKINRKRFMRMFLILFLVSFGVSCLVLLSIPGSAARWSSGIEINFFRQALLWGSLSLFFGIFFGMIISNQNMGK
jgi:hypothetical protein